MNYKVISIEKYLKTIGKDENHPLLGKVFILKVSKTGEIVQDFAYAIFHNGKIIFDHYKCGLTHKEITHIVVNPKLLKIWPN